MFSYSLESLRNLFISDKIPCTCYCFQYDHVAHIKCCSTLFSSLHQEISGYLGTYKRDDLRVFKKSSKYKKVKKGGNQKSKRDRKFVFAPFIYMPPLFFCCSSALCASWFVHCPGNCAVSMTTYSSQGRVRPGGIQ